MRSLTPRASLAIAGLVIPVIVTSAPAQSADQVVTPHAPAFRTATATFEDTASGLQLATAVCPAGEHVVAGGFTGQVGGFAVLNRAVKKRTAWRVKGSFAEGSIAYAYCSKALSVTSTTNATSVPVETATTYANATSTASCPKGTRAVAGGWQLKPMNLNSPIFTSAPQGKRGWTVVGLLGTGEPYKLKSYAYCLDLELDRDMDVATQAVAAPAGDAVTTATATCDGGTVIGGGFATTPEPDFENDTGPDTFFFGSSNDGKKGHTVSAINYSDVAGTVTAYAVCLG